MGKVNKESKAVTDNKRTLLKVKKGKLSKRKGEASKADVLFSEDADFGRILKDKKDGTKAKRNTEALAKVKRRKSKKDKNSKAVDNFSVIASENENGKSLKGNVSAGNFIELETLSKVDDFGEPEEKIGAKLKSKKVKKAKKSKEKNVHIMVEEKKSLCEVNAEMVYQISSADEDSSRGMKKWLAEYKQSRPGLKILQQRIDEFMIAYDAQKEQERKESEALAAEGGWTVVVHHKGRKKTTDTESGITVGSVAQAAVMDKLAKKKSKEINLDFYRFQKREAKRNEVMILQSKFEQDKKRIQQLRAARKFRPY
ncbi:uncharacterized protein [Typha angustifolia]|uniref:uncharacterized protein isoform X2 n=1 Tax=Typha angustifolia TaxID=59011 RepID=UPI003C306619